MQMFHKEQGLKFVVRLITNRGGRRDLELPASSVQDAVDQARALYKKCVIEHVDLIVRKKSETTSRGLRRL